MWIFTNHGFVSNLHFGCLRLKLVLTFLTKGSLVYLAVLAQRYVHKDESLKISPVGHEKKYVVVFLALVHAISLVHVSSISLTRYAKNMLYVCSHKHTVAMVD